MSGAQEAGQGGALRVEQQAGGGRLVSWSRIASDGTVMEFQHRCPDALRHHYRPAGVDEDVLLHHGAFFYPGDEGGYEGDVRFRWHPSPHVEVRGERSTTPADIANLLSGDGSHGIWVEPGAIEVALPDGALPNQPEEAFVARGAPGDSFHEADLQQSVGEPAALEQVTFLVPNGWQGHDGIRICDPVDLTRTWFGRTEASGDGWTVTLDSDAEMDADAWRELEDRGGRRFTHIGRLIRADGSTFTGQEAFEVLARLRLGLNLALGRRTTCALPVGWLGAKPMWSRWRSSPVDAWRSVSHWLDGTACCQQVAEVVSLTLAFTADSASREALKHAVSYYVAANVDVDVELSVAVPLSGLQLLSYFRFVTERGSHSHGKWKTLSPEAQLRLLLDDTEIETSVPAHFGHLVSAQARLARNAPARDALGLAVKMRNVVTHPTRDHPSHFCVYEWAEAGMLTRYWLCLALLNTVGYQGQLAAGPPAQPRRMGQLQPVPWG